VWHAFAVSIIDNLRARYIETWAHKRDVGPENELGGPESWTVPHLGNYT